MEKIIEDLFKQLMVINDFLDKKVLTEEDAVEEKDHFEEALWHATNLRKLLMVYQNVPIANTRAGRINAIKVRNDLANLGWYFTHLSKQGGKVFENYPVPEEIYNKERVYCCERMRGALASEDNPVEYDCVIREYSIRCIENIGATEAIDYCLWCAYQFPRRLKSELLALLKKEYGIESDLLELAHNKNVPEEFKGDEWWKKREL